MTQTSSSTGAHDYVIVGAGSAGAVLAARLTEDPGVRVLLLEAGPEAEADEISIPAAFPALFKTRWDWNYSTTEQKQLHNRRAYWPRMKALGGCSSMNAMIYIRGNAADYDAWRDEYGAAGWGYDDVLPYFVRAEGNTRLGSPYHGQDGPLHVEDRRYTHELTDLWVESAVSAGMKPTDDFNGAEQEGAGRYQVTCRNGRRWSVNEGYLKPVRDRDNLDVETGAFATRIVVEGDRATGVTYRRGGREVTATATREVLLCGGAVNSPHLLMLSGIGPAAHLREHGIDVVADLAGVGPAAAGPPGRPDDLVHPRHHRPRGVLQRAQPAAVEGARHRTAVLQRRRGWRVPADAGTTSGAGHAVPRRARRVLRQRAARADPAHVHRGADAGLGAQPRLPAAALGRPGLAPRDRRGVLRRRGRPRRHARRR